MGLFYRRPLCFFAFLFVAFSLFCFLSSLEVALLFLCVIAVSLVLLSAAFFWRKPKKHILCLTAILSLGVVLFSVGYSILTVALPLRSARQYVGEQTVLAEVVREEYRVDDYALYSVRLLQIGEKSVKISATLSCHSSESFSPMDRVFAKADVSILETKNRDGVLLCASVEKDEPIYLQRNSENLSWKTLLCSPSGIQVFSERCRNALSKTMVLRFGEEVGGLASVVFLGDRSALSTTIVRDFSRSGTSHLMAVSGLHFSILFGALDLLLRALCCPRKGRIPIVAVGSIIFLFLTGFSMSACRAAMMLYALYLNFLLREENDSITSLFVSFALIVLLSPYAIIDLGLWMSFLATLGILMFYPVLSSKLPMPRGDSRVRRFLLKLLRESVVLVLLTVIATLFLLPILWGYFGEFSAVSLLANPVASPIAELFLVVIPIWFLCSWIPVLSWIVGACLNFLGKAILSVLSFFSRFSLATVSLNYAFCRILIPLLVVGIVVVLVLRFRRKWIAFLPPVAFVLAFMVCFGIVRGLERVPDVEYISQQSGEEAMLILDGDEAALCDLSGGSPWLYREVAEKLSQTTATELESVVLTQYHESHLSSMEYLLSSELVRTVYLPMPRDAEAGKIAAELWEIADQSGSEIVFYEGGKVSLTENVLAEIELGMGEADAFAVTLIGEQDRVSYVTPKWLEASGVDKAERWLAQSQTLIVGRHGEQPNGSYGAIFKCGSLERVIYASERSANCYQLTFEGGERYVMRKRNWSWKFELS